MTIKLVLLVAVGFSNALAEYCYVEDEVPYLRFATVTAYERVRAKEMKTTLSECKAKYVWALIRHGTRFMTKQKSADEQITMLQKEIVTNHEIHKRGKLCDKDLQSVKQWTYKWKRNMNGELAPQGVSDLASLAARLHQKFHNLLSASAANFKFETSSVPRCKDSAVAFTNELFRSRPADLDKVEIVENNSLLRILDQKKNKGKAGGEYEKFIKSEYVKQMISEISDRLGFEEPLTFEHVSKLFKFCSFESAWELHSKSSFCTSFTPEHLQIMEYAEDLDHYYSIGYGNELNAKLASPLIRDLLTKFDISAKNNISEVASIYFSHSQALLPFVTKLDLFRDEEPLKSENYEKMKVKRKWRTSFIDPFAANMIAVLYECETDHKVMFYNNEQLIMYPGCENGVCSLETLKKKFQNEFKEDDETSDSKTSRSLASVTVFYVLTFVWCFKSMLQIL